MSILSIKKVRDVTDEEYQAALEQYTPCLNKTSKSWMKFLGVDEAKHLASIALWRAMQSFDENRDGVKAKFLTHLMNYIQWTFLEARKESLKAPLARDILPSDVSVQPEDIDDRCDAIKFYLNERQKRVVELLSEGKDATYISDDIGISRQRVHQIFSQIRYVHHELSSSGTF
jgi:DNA-directed RNA polymerase specialized sigma subunit